MEKSKKTKSEIFFDKYFPFFKIPGFMPKKWIKNIFKKWKKYFKKEKSLKEGVEDKEADLAALNFEDGLTALETMTDDAEEAASFIEDLLEKFNKQETNLNTAITNIKETLDGILEKQNNYQWYAG